MSTNTDTFTYWAAEMISLLENERLEQVRWFARVNSVLVSATYPMVSLRTAERILQTPQNLKNWKSQHGERDVDDGISMILHYVHSHWRPSWYEIAGYLRPEEIESGAILRSPKLPALPAVVAASRSSSPDAMDVENTLAVVVSTFIHAPPPIVALSDMQPDNAVTYNATRSDKGGVEYPSSTVSRGTCVEDTVAVPETGPPLSISEHSLSTLQVHSKIPGPIVKEGPMTRSRSRDENANQPESVVIAKALASTQSAPVDPNVLAQENQTPTASQTLGTTARRVVLRQPVRKRLGVVDAPARKQPKRNTRKNAVQDTVAQVQSTAFRLLPLSISVAELT